MRSRGSLFGFGRAVLIAVLIAAVALVLIRQIAPYCAADRLCVWSAGFSLIAPPRWRLQTVEGTELLVLAPDRDSSIRIVVEDVTHELEIAAPVSLDAIERSVNAGLLGGGHAFRQVSNVSVERIALPIGPAVRARWLSTTTFILTSRQGNDTVWFPSDARAIVISFQQVFGEGPGNVPADSAGTFQELLESLQPLEP